MGNSFQLGASVSSQLAVGKQLVLDTRQGDVAERLYLKQGYIRAGSIPQYARSADGTLHTTVFFYRLLEGQPASGAEPYLG